MLGAHLARTDSPTPKGHTTSPTWSSPPAPWPGPNASACRSIA